MRRKEHIAVFAAHPDDEGSAWATLSKYSKYGNKISIIWMTHGGAFIAPLGKYAHYLPYLIKSRYSEETKRKLSHRIKSIRKREAERAAKLIGAETYFLGFKDTGVPTITDLSAIRIITNLIRKIKPTIILTHFFREGHIDHRHTSALVMKSTLISRKKDYLTEFSSHRVRIFGFWNERGRAFKPNFYLNVQNQIKSLKLWGNCYKSQSFRIVGRFAEFLAKWNSRKTPYSYVEAYQIFGGSKRKNFGEFFP